MVKHYGHIGSIANMSKFNSMKFWFMVWSFRESLHNLWNASPVVFFCEARLHFAICSQLPRKCQEKWRCHIRNCSWVTVFCLPLDFNFSSKFTVVCQLYVIWISRESETRKTCCHILSPDVVVLFPGGYQVISNLNLIASKKAQDLRWLMSGSIHKDIQFQIICIDLTLTKLAVGGCNLILWYSNLQLAASLSQAVVNEFTENHLSSGQMV